MSTEPNQELPKVPGQPEAVLSPENLDTDPVGVMQERIKEMKILLNKGDILTQAEKELDGQLKMLEQRVTKLNREQVKVSGLTTTIKRMMVQTSGLHGRIAALRGEILAVQAEVVKTAEPGPKPVETPEIKRNKLEKSLMADVAEILASREKPGIKEALLNMIIKGSTKGFTVSPVIKKESNLITELGVISEESKHDATVALGLLQILQDDTIKLKDRVFKLKDFLSNHEDKNIGDWPLFKVLKKNADEVIKVIDGATKKSVSKPAESDPVVVPVAEVSPTAVEPEPVVVTKPVVEPITELSVISESKNAGSVSEHAVNKEITKVEFVAALCNRFFKDLRIFATDNGRYEVVVGPNQRVDLFAVEWKRILPDQDFNRFAKEMGLDPRVISLNPREISSYIFTQVKARDAKSRPESNDAENAGREGFSKQECEQIIETVFSGVTLSRRGETVVVTDSNGSIRPYKKFVKEEVFDDPTSFDRLARVYKKITGQNRFNEEDVMNRILGFLEATLPADSNLPEPARVTAPVDVPVIPRPDAREHKSASVPKVETPEQSVELSADNETSTIPESAEAIVKIETAPTPPFAAGLTDTEKSTPKVEAQETKPVTFELEDGSTVDVGIPGFKTTLTDEMREVEDKNKGKDKGKDRGKRPPRTARVITIVYQPTWTTSESFNCKIDISFVNRNSGTVGLQLDLNGSAANRVQFKNPSEIQAVIYNFKGDILLETEKAKQATAAAGGTSVSSDTVFRPGVTPESGQGTPPESGPAASPSSIEQNAVTEAAAQDKSEVLKAVENSLNIVEGKLHEFAAVIDSLDAPDQKVWLTTLVEYEAVANDIKHLLKWDPKKPAPQSRALWIRANALSRALDNKLIEVKKVGNAPVATLEPEPPKAAHAPTVDHHESAHGHTPDAHAPTHHEHAEPERRNPDLMIVDIPEHEIAKLFPAGTLQEIIVGLTDPSTHSKAVLDFKYFFTQCNNKTELAEQVKKFGYKSLGEFLQHWTTELHKKPLKAFEMWVDQIQQKAIDESITFSDNVGAGVTWEKFKKVGRMAARLTPVAIAAAAGTAATIALTGGAALAGAGVAGAISGFFGRFFKKSETFKKTDKEAAARVAEKEAAIRQEKSTDTEVRGKVTKGVAAIDENQFRSFLSQALRDSSADGLNVGQPANAALIRAHGLRVIERALAVRRRTGEDGLKSEQERLEKQLDSAIATLYSNGQEDQARVRALVEKNPLMQKALAKVLEIKGGGSIEEKNSQLKEVMGYVGAMAAGAGLSIATTMNSLWRMAPGGLAGGYIGMMFGHEKDKEAQAKAFVKDAIETIAFAEDKFLPPHEKNETYLLNSIDSDLDQADSKLRTILQLGLLDNRIELKVRANNVLRRMDALRLEKDGEHIEQLDNLMTQLDAKTKTLQVRKNDMINSLDKRTNWRRAAYGVAGFVTGGLVGLYGAQGMRWAYGLVKPDQELLHMDIGGSAHPHAAEMEMPQSHRGPDIPEFNEPKFSVADFAKDHNLDDSTKEYLIRLTNKFPDLKHEESLERLLVAGERGSLPEFGNRESGVFLQEAAEADTVKFEEILRHGGPAEAAKYLEARGFNSLDHRLLGTKDYLKFSKDYQTKVMSDGSTDTHLRAQLGKALQHDEMRDSAGWASSKTGKTMYGDGARTSLGRGAVILGTDETLPRGGVIADKAKEFLYNKSFKPESLKLDPDQLRRLNDARAIDLVEKVKSGEIDLHSVKSQLPVEHLPAGQRDFTHLELSTDPGYVDVYLPNGETMKAAIHVNAAGEPVLVSSKYELENARFAPTKVFTTPEKEFGPNPNYKGGPIRAGGVERVPEDSAVVAARVLENKSAQLFEQQVSRLTTEASVLQNTLGIKAALTDELGNAGATDKAFQDFAREFIKGRPEANITDPRFQAEFSQAWNAHGTELIAKHAIELDVQASEDDVNPDPVPPPEPTGTRPLPERVQPVRTPEPIPVKSTRGMPPPTSSKPGAEVLPTTADVLGASKDQNLVLMGLNNKDQMKLSVWDKSEAKAVGLTLKSDYVPKVGEDGRLEIKLGEYSAKGEIQKVSIAGKPKWAFVVKDDALTEWFPLDHLNKGDTTAIVPDSAKK